MIIQSIIAIPRWRRTWACTMKMSDLKPPTPLSGIVWTRAEALTENSVRQLYTGKGLYFTVFLELQNPTFAELRNLIFRTTLPLQDEQQPKFQLLFLKENVFNLRYTVATTN